ncbi:GrpB family protein [Streptomyces sp. NPDC004111]|uniref:GrpB family protein n=1 Tax=Streptomyces sp. NPDC004111 TaxID=3364690 RepID=UPI0036786B4E
MPFPDEPSTVTISPYLPSWPDEFEVLAARLHDALGGLAVAIDHIGSTSVPGLPAKDCVDVQVRVRPGDLELRAADIGAAFGTLGFRRRPEPWNQEETSLGSPCRKLVFAPPPGARRCNVHVREHDAPNSRFALLFRDYLRADASAREAWGTFKRRLSDVTPDLASYGQIKAPATDILVAAAQQWAVASGRRP